MPDFLKNFDVYAEKILFAVAILVIGFLLVQLFVKTIKKLVLKTKIEKTVLSFLISVLRILLYLVVSISALGTLGVNISSLIAAVGAAALTAGLALQSTLTNIVSGIVLLINRPFVAGDVLEFEGITARVVRISIFSTTLLTYDNREVTIPNSKLTTGNILNLHSSGKRRVDFNYSVSYDTDFDKAERVLHNIIEKCEYKLCEPEYTVQIGAYLDSGVEIQVWIWTEPEHYFDVYYYMQDNVIREFRNNGIEIPYPHIVVKND